MTSRLRMVLLAGCAVLAALHAESAGTALAQSFGGRYAGVETSEGADERLRGGGVGSSAQLAPRHAAARDPARGGAATDDLGLLPVGLSSIGLSMSH